MRLKLKMSAFASLMAVTALSIQGLSPATAADPVPTATATAPAAPAVEDESPAETEAEGLVDVTVQDKTTSIPLPVGAFELPLGVAGFDLDGKQTLLVPPWTNNKYGGEAVALNINVNVLGLLQLKSRKLGASPMTTHDGGGNPGAKRMVTAYMPGFFFGPPEMKAYAGSSYTDSQLLAYGDMPRAEAGAKIAELVVPFVSADGIEATARAEQLDNGEWETVTHVRFARLDINGVKWQDTDVEPNRTHVIPGLGKVVLNEQKITRLPGDRYAAKVTAIHITLNTATLGLPVGTDIYIGTAEAIVYE